MNKENKPKRVIGRLHGGGLSDPFIARMMMGICDIRDFIFTQDKERREFDKYYNSVRQNLQEARFVKDKFKEVYENHLDKVMNGNIAKYEESFIKVDETVDFDCNIYFKDFFIRGYIALDCLKMLTDKIFDTNIEFFFKPDKSFEQGMNRFKAKYPGYLFKFFIDMLIDERKTWFSLFVEMRRKIEHKGFELAKVQYILKGNVIIPIFPKIGKREIVDEFELIWENLFSFCEDVIVMMFSSKITKKSGLGIMHIPENMRDQLKPIKYKVSIMPPKELLEQMEFPNKD